MNPIRTTATNYKTFAHLDIEWPTGIAVIIGANPADNNGFGKSAMIDAIDLALFAERGELAQWLTIGEEDLEIGLTFEHAGELYRVRRQYSARGKGKTTLDFEWLKDAPLHSGDDTGPQWEPLTRETAAATSELIEKTIGLSRTTFRSSSFLKQRDGGAFSEADPAVRKRTLAEILALDLWDDSRGTKPPTPASLLGAAKLRLRACEDDLLKSRALIEGCDLLVEAKPMVEALIHDLSGHLTLSREALSDGEVQYELAQAELAAAAVLAEQVRTAEAELTAARDAHERAIAEFSAATEAAHQLVDKKIELDDVSADADQVPALEDRLAAIQEGLEHYRRSQALKDSIVAEADQRDLARGRMVEQALGMHDDARTMRQKATHLDVHIAEAGDCDRCGQKLGAEAAARAAESYRRDADDLDGKANRLDAACEQELAEIAGLRERAAAVALPIVEDPAPVDRDLAAARRAAERKASLVEQVRQLTEKTAQRVELNEKVTATAALVDEKQTALDKSKEGVVDETALQAKVSRWRIAVHEARGLIETRQADLVRAQTELERIVLAETKLEEHRNVIVMTQARVDVLKIAEKAYGRDGIPALIVENAAIPQLELEANRILGELGGATAGCRIELRTQKALKSSADQLRETLDIVIVTPTGERAYETFSGGERTRLNLALRIALARLLAHRRGAESRLLAIDEPDGLDQAGMQALATVLQGVGGDFERILLVSHHPELATAFDQTIVVVKDGERSRVDAGALAVAA